MEGDADDFGARLVEVVAFVDAPAGVGDVIGSEDVEAMGGSASESSSSDPFSFQVKTAPSRLTV